MELILGCTNEIVFGMEEVHNYILNSIKNNQYNNNNILYTNPFPEQSECVSVYKSDIVMKDHNTYKQIGTNEDIFCSCDQYCDVMSNPIIFKILFPFQNHDCYLGTIVASFANSSNIQKLRIIKNITDL